MVSNTKKYTDNSFSSIHYMSYINTKYIISQCLQQYFLEFSFCIGMYENIYTIDLFVMLLSHKARTPEFISLFLNDLFYSYIPIMWDSKCMQPYIFIPLPLCPSIWVRNFTSGLLMKFCLIHVPWENWSVKINHLFFILICEKGGLSQTYFCYIVNLRFPVFWGIIIY